jgi:hypothetical protein
VTEDDLGQKVAEFEFRGGRDLPKACAKRDIVLLVFLVQKAQTPVSKLLLFGSYSSSYLVPLTTFCRKMAKRNRVGDQTGKEIGPTLDGTIC